MESFEILGYNTSVSFKRKQKHPHMGVGWTETLSSF